MIHSLSPTLSSFSFLSLPILTTLSNLGFFEAKYSMELMYSEIHKYVAHTHFFFLDPQAYWMTIFKNKIVRFVICLLRPKPQVIGAMVVEHLGQRPKCFRGNHSFKVCGLCAADFIKHRAMHGRRQNTGTAFSHKFFTLFSNHMFIFLTSVLFLKIDSH